MVYTIIGIPGAFIVWIHVWGRPTAHLYQHYMDRVKRIWYLSPMRAAKVQASLRIRAVSPEPPLLAHKSSESRGTFRQKARSLAPLNGWACAVKICHDGMLEDINSLGAAHIEINSHWLSDTGTISRESSTSLFIGFASFERDTYFLNLKVNVD